MKAALDKGNEQAELGKAELKKLPKTKLIELILEEREAARRQLDEKEKRIAELTEQLTVLQREQDEERNKQKIGDINKHANEPSSKKPEWDKDGNPKQKKRRKKRKKRKKRPGYGNGGKSDIVPDETNHTPLDACPRCGIDLSDKEGNKWSGRIVEISSRPRRKRP